MLYTGLDLSRQWLDVRILDEAGRTVGMTAVRPDADALRSLAMRRPARRRCERGHRVDERRPLRPRLALARRLGRGDRRRRPRNGLAPFVAETDKIDAWSPHGPSGHLTTLV